MLYIQNTFVRNMVQYIIGIRINNEYLAMITAVYKIPKDYMPNLIRISRNSNHHDIICIKKFIQIHKSPFLNTGKEYYLNIVLNIRHQEILTCLKSYFTINK